jgi:GTPase
LDNQNQKFKIEREKAVLIALVESGVGESSFKEQLSELRLLAFTSGAKTVKTFVQNQSSPDNKTYVGKGKFNEIKTFIEENEIEIAIFNDDLSPGQARNIEQGLKCKVLDRSLLILNIFSMRAQTAQAKTQVELAQYEYLLPRLTRMWTHLSKQKGGIGMKGPGETELETDRRIVRDKISLLKKKLEKIEKQNLTQRKNRSRMVRVALVGYTNVGKSTLMRLISKEKVLVEDQLFATVDSTVRKVVYENFPFLLTDTVGFIRKLPTTLIESFKSTLNEVREADVLLHVVDLSNPNYEEQIEVVEKTLLEIGAGDKRVIRVFNKIDAYHYDPEDRPFEKDTPVSIEELKTSFLNGSKAVFISALQKTNIRDLRQEILEEVKEVFYSIFPNYLPSES